MQSELKEAVRRVFLELLEDREFRYAIAGATGLLEILGRLDRHEETMVKLLGEIAKLREDMNLGFKRHDEELARLREDTNATFRKFSEELVKLRRDMDSGFATLNRKIDALGARWGIMSEEAFRAGMRGIIERELGLKVERWAARDDEGMVYGYPSDVEIDIVVSDDKVIIVEVKSSVSRGDVAAFKRKAEFYERKTGVKPSRLMIITPYADEKAKEAATSHGIEIYSI